VHEKPRTVTSHIFLSLDAAGVDLVAQRGSESSGKGCAISRTPEAPSGNGAAWLVCVGSFAAIGFRRIRRERLARTATKR
ncbi:MAG: hypothetical protein ABIP89_18825, partial [Polyangiaceae bacterium]